jgi:hypothetical protein
MTNEQLAIFIKQLANRLGDEIVRVDNSLPDEERFEIQEFIGGGNLFGLDRLTSTPQKDPEKWQVRKGDVIALDGLRSIVVELEEYTKILSPQTAA